MRVELEGEGGGQWGLGLHRKALRTAVNCSIYFHSRDSGNVDKVGKPVLAPSRGHCCAAGPGRASRRFTCILKLNTACLKGHTYVRYCCVAILLLFFWDSSWVFLSRDHMQDVSRVCDAHLP
ncbi:unnamed protein product [Pylaiella littoralis]